MFSLLLILFFNSLKKALKRDRLNGEGVESLKKCIPPKLAPVIHNSWNFERFSITFSVCF